MTPLNPDYLAFVDELKARVAAARLSAARAVNRDIIPPYWDISRPLKKSSELGWARVWSKRWQMICGRRFR